MSGTTLHTIGYEKTAFAPFIATLQAAGIARVIDVRDLPLSRRPGFSKTALAAGLHAAGIAYTHLRPLGTPPAGREANRRRQWPEFWRIVEARLQTPEAQDALHHAATLATTTPAACSATKPTPTPATASASPNSCAKPTPLPCTT